MPANDINLENGLGQKVYWPHMQMTFAPERQPSSASSSSLFTLKLLPRRRQLKLKTYLTPFRCISCRRHPLRMSNVCFSPIAGWLCEVFPSVRFTAQASLMQTGKPTCGNMRLTNYSIHTAPRRAAIAALIRLPASARKSRGLPALALLIKHNGAKREILK